MHLHRPPNLPTASTDGVMIPKALEGQTIWGGGYSYRINRSDFIIIIIIIILCHKKIKTEIMNLMELIGGLINS